MPIFDQFEIEDNEFYSGSYGSKILLGDISPQDERLQRTVIGDKNDNSLNQEFNRFNILYSDRLAWVVGKRRQSYTSNKIISATDLEEYIYDSLLPAPSEISQINDFDVPFLSASFGISAPFFYLGSAISGSSLFGRKPTIERSAHVFFSGDGSPIQGDSLAFPANSFIDTLWQNSPFTFKTKYKNLKRYIISDDTLPNYVNVTKDIAGDAITSFKTNKKGSMYFTYSRSEFDEWSRICNIWTMSTSLNLVPNGTDGKLSRAYNTNWNTINDIVYNNYFGDYSSSYIAVAGEENAEGGTILTSSNGIIWTAVAKGEHNEFDSAPNAVNDPIVISDPSTLLNNRSITRALPIGIDGTEGVGTFYRWALIVSNQLVISPDGTEYNIPPKTSWSVVDIADDLSLGFISLQDLEELDMGGNSTFSAGADHVVVCGSEGVTNGFIAFSDKDCLTWRRAPGAVAQQASVTWKATTIGNSIYNFVFACGQDAGGFPTKGIIARVSRTGTVSSNTWTDVTPTVGGSPDPEILNDIDFEDGNSILICVGNNGTILRSTNGGGTWSKRTAPSGYTGNYRRVYARPGTTQWYAVGADGALHYSTDRGLNWAVASKDRLNYDFGTTTGPRAGFAGSRIKQKSSAGGSMDAPPAIIFSADAKRHPFVAGNQSIAVFRLLDEYFPGNNSGNNSALEAREGTVFSGSIKTTPSLLDYNKVYFGFGNGVAVDLSNLAWGAPVRFGKGSLPSFSSFSVNDFFEEPDISTFKLYGPKISGWKYGIYNGIPTSNKAVFRFNKYGNLRDMLEQRIQTATLIKKNGSTSISYPVDVAFISGSDSFEKAKVYATASSPTSFDPTDNGFYDYHCRTGQPFFDG